MVELYRVRRASLILNSLARWLNMIDEATASAVAANL